MRNSTLMRKSPLKRRTPLARGNKPLRRTRLRNRSPKKAIEDRVYTRKRAAYLAAHPLCQAMIAENNLFEDKVLDAFLAGGGVSLLKKGHGVFIFNGIEILTASEIHHRNKSNGRRRNDERFWLSISREMHDKIESSKDWARGRGLLLPINATPDGFAGDRQHLTTPALLELRAGEKGPPVNF